MEENPLKFDIMKTVATAYLCVKPGGIRDQVFTCIVLHSKRVQYLQWRSTGQPCGRDSIKLM
eukprot:5849985-Amphidinium_carterae.1